MDSAPTEPAPAHVAFRPARTNRLLGTNLSTSDQAVLLARVGIATRPAPAEATVAVAAGARPLAIPAIGETLLAQVPSWRRDLAVEADMIEEIARIHGYEHIPSNLPHTPMPAFRADPLEVRDAIRATLAGAGLTETVTLALVSPAIVERFPAVDDGAPDGEPDQAAGGSPVRVTNPLSAQHAVLRQRVLGSLLEVVATNLRHGRDEIAIFEIGKGYGTGPDQDQPTHEWWRLAFALTGAGEPRGWSRQARAYDLDDAKGIVELLATRLSLALPTYERLADDPTLHPGRSATTGPGGAIVGRIGELHPMLLDHLEIRATRVIVGELAIAGLASGRLVHAKVRTPSRHPVVERDLAVVVSDDRPASAVAESIRRHGGVLLRSVELFDRYRGSPLTDDEISLAFRLTFADHERSLTEADVSVAVDAVTAGLVQDVGGRLRI